MYTESRKMVLRTYLQGSRGDADPENRLMDMGTGMVERVGRMESRTETYSLTYVKYIARGTLLYDSGN